jgi:lipoate-protein ligase A
MQRLHLTLPTPAENLALDEALLDHAEENDAEFEVLRIWESPQPIVVVGRSSRVEQEVDLAACRARQIPVLRRSSGGAAIVAGPGCLMYAVVLSYTIRPELRDLRRAHAHVLDRIGAALQRAIAHIGKVMRAGTSDLVIANFDQSALQSAIRNPQSEIRKFSGNSLRAKRRHFLYHGTLLYNFDLSLIETCLRAPPRQPEYRAARSHRDFVMNLPASQSALIRAVDDAWPTTGELKDWPATRVADLVAERFGRDDWNLHFG